MQRRSCVTWADNLLKVLCHVERQCKEDLVSVGRQPAEGRVKWKVNALRSCGTWGGSVLKIVWHVQ
jgi:hypothetical protein